MTLSFLSVLIAGALTGGFINGLAGFGTSLFALGFWLQVLPAETAVAMAVVMSVISGAQGLWVVRAEIRREKSRLLRFILPGLIGIPFGVALLSVMNAEVLKPAIAGFMLLYGGFFLSRRSLPQFTRATPVADRLIGFGGGILGGAASLSGVLPTMWCAMRPWSKGETRAVLQPYNFTILGITLILLICYGALTPETLRLLLIVLLPTLIGSQLGIALFKHLSDSQFRYLLVALMFVSGLVLGLRELL